MSRTMMIVGASLLAAIALATTSVRAQDLSPSKPPSGTEKPGAKPDAGDATLAQPATDSPRRPNAQSGGAAQRRNLDGANMPIPDDIQVVRDVVYATAPSKDGVDIELKMDCAFLKQSDGQPMPVIIYIHGGGWSGGDRAMGMPFSLAFARGGYFACTISYRLSGQAIYPAQIHDVKSAVRFIRANADKLAIDPARIGVWGHSAGGHLSALLGVTGDGATLEGDVGERNGSSAVQAVVDVSGPTDLLLIAPGGNGGSMISGLIGGPVREKEEVARAASPVTYVDDKDAPFLIIQGGKDNLVPDEQAEVMRDALLRAGVECEYLYIPEAGHGVTDRRAYQATAAFFDKHLGGDAVDAFEQIANRLPGAGGGAGGRRNQQQPPPATQPQ